MDQIAAALELSISGEKGEEIARKVILQMNEWDVPLAPSSLIILDFGLEDYSKYGLAESWIVNELALGYCGKYLFLFANQICPNHRHERKTETFFILKGKVRLSINGDEIHELDPGDVYTITPGNFHEIYASENSLILELSQPCIVDDNFFEDTRVCYGGNYQGK